MANTKSAIKTNRRIQRQTLVNKSRKSRYRNAIKKINLLIEKKIKKGALSFSKIKFRVDENSKNWSNKKTKCIKKCFKNYKKN